MGTSPCLNSVAGHQIATNFCTCHDSTAVVPCAKFCSDHSIRLEMRVKRNFHRIWNAMEKPLVKRGPGDDLVTSGIAFTMVGQVPWRHVTLAGIDVLIRTEYNLQRISRCFAIYQILIVRKTPTARGLNVRFSCMSGDPGSLLYEIS